MDLKWPEVSDQAALVSHVIGDWSTERAFRVDEVLQEHPSLAADHSAVVSLAKEEFIRRLEAGEDLSIFQFAARFPDVQSQLIPRLQNALTVGREVGLWGAGPAPQWPCVGGEICGYHLTEHIGSGAFSRVFLASDTTVGDRCVVVKVTTRARSELRLLGPLEHAHLPQILHAGRDEQTGMVAVSMRHVGRRTSLDWLDQLPVARAKASDRQTPDVPQGPEVAAAGADGSPRSMDDYVRTTLRIMAEVADALAFTHQQGILHLDVKPSNIVLTDQLSAVLIDFNAAVPTQRSHLVHFCGTPVYAAPELLEAIVTGRPSETPVSEAADIHSLGVVLYQLLTEELPWTEAPDGRAQEIAPQLLEAKRGRIRRASDLNPTVPAAVDELLFRALAAEPQERLASAAEFRDVLTATLREHPVPRPRRRRAARRLMAVGGIVAMLLTVVVIRSRSQPTDPQAPPISPQPSSLERSLPIVEESLERGWRAMRSGEKDVAFQTFEAGLAESDDARLLASWAYAGLTTERLAFKDARDAFQQASDEGLDEDVGVCCDLSYCLIRLGSVEAARRILDDALEYDPHNMALLFHRSYIELTRAEKPRAEKPSPKFAKHLIELGAPWPIVFLDAAVVISLNMTDPNGGEAEEARGYLRRARELGATRREVEHPSRHRHITRLLSPLQLKQFVESLPTSRSSGNKPDLVEPAFVQQLLAESAEPSSEGSLSLLR